MYLLYAADPICGDLLALALKTSFTILLLMENFSICRKIEIIALKC